MKALNFIIIKLTFFLVVGILLAHSFHLSLAHIFYIIIGVIILSAITFYIENQSFSKHIWFGLLAYILMLVLGMFTYNTHHHKNFARHYSNIKSVDITDSNYIYFRIKERLKPTQYHNKYVVELIKLNDYYVKGNTLLNIEKSQNSKPFSVDDILLVQSAFEDIGSPLNPNQFNYKAYLEKQYIYHQLYTQQEHIFKLTSNHKTIFGYADMLRRNINKQLIAYDFKPEELAIINALILGQRQDMDRETYTNYANAGAIHILAVSGLHVGIILMILNIVLKPLEQLKRGHIIKVISILMLLWSFAIVAGLSASVTRAVTMFSIVAIAMHVKRPTNIYNTLCISIFILLLFKPIFLFDIGFQMSYLAVFAIVSIQPLLSKLWIPKWKLLNYFWQIFTVTIAAQLGVLPISLFYFHQFPSLFFISNLAIIPFLGLILGFGILVIILSVINMLPEMVANIYGSLINTMNLVVSWVSKQEAFLIKDISFDASQVITSYIFILASVLAYRKFHFKRIIMFLISIMLLQGAFIQLKHKNSTEIFVIFHKSRHSIIGKKKNDDLKIWHSLDNDAIQNENIISNYKVGNFINSISFDSLYNVYKTPHKTLLVVDSLGAYNVSFKTDYVLLRNSPRINLKRLIDSLQPKLIIADGSNYKSYAQRWKATCLKEKLPFHYTYEKGAFILK